MLTSKEMWNALEATFKVSDAGCELYVMEQLYDYKMVHDHFVVEKVHEIHTPKKLKNF